MSYSVPASRNGLPLAVAAQRRPVAHPGPIGVPRRRELPPEWAGQAQQIAGASIPPAAVLPVNASPTAQAVRGAVSGVSEIHRVAIARRQGVGPGALEPGQTGQPGGATGGAGGAGGGAAGGGGMAGGGGGFSGGGGNIRRTGRVSLR